MTKTKAVLLQVSWLLLLLFLFNVFEGVRWEYTVDMLCEVVESIKSESLSQLLLYAAKDYRSFGKGLPDLTLWRKKGKPRILLVEVKGE